MERVSTKIFINNVNDRIAKNFKSLQEVQIKLASGKDINKPSDNPIGTSEALRFKNTISGIGQFKTNITYSKSWLSISESSMQELSNITGNARVLATQFLNSTVSNTTAAVAEIDGMIADIIKVGSRTINNRYMFSGFKTDTAAVSSAASGAVYFGDSNDINMEFDFGIKIPVNIPGSDFLSADLNTDINSDTLLSSLNRGSGISLGSISITDRSGSSATVSLVGATTVGEVISAINSSGLNVTASINSAGNGIEIADTTSSITGSLTIAESGGGTTASDLGILGTRNGDMTGKDLNAKAISSTPISLLYGGSGLSLDDIKIVNGASSGTVSFSSLSSSSTLGDIINLINTSGLNVTADINSNGTSLTISSTDSSTVAVVTDIGVGSTASDLGLGGKKNILANMLRLRDGLQKGDKIAIGASLDNMASNLENILNLRGTIGGRINRIEASEGFLDKLEVDTRSSLSNVEDADIEKVALQFATFKTAYETTLASAAQILNINLLDFLR